MKKMLALMLLLCLLPLNGLAEYKVTKRNLAVKYDTDTLKYTLEEVKMNGTVCYVPLSADLKEAVGEAVTLFSGLSPYYIEERGEDSHYVTDGPFMYRTKNGTLLMLWSTFINDQYAECLVRFENGSIKHAFEHLPPLIDDDGGHGMIFQGRDKLYLTFHTPNQSGYEHPKFLEIEDTGDSVVLG